MDLRPGITAAIATHPARMANGFFQRAMGSVCRQTLQPRAIVVANDTGRYGAPWSRQACVDMADTEWMAWLDSDDEWYPQHLERLHSVAVETGSVFVFSWFDAPHDPLGHFGKPFDPAHPHHTTITFLVRTELAKEVGFPTDPEEGRHSNEDWFHIAGVAALADKRGYRMTHLAERTWRWDQSGQNTSGKPNQGDAR